MSPEKSILRLKRVFLYFSVTVYFAILLFPIYWIVVTSIQKGGSINFIPKEITLDNYIRLFQTGKFSIATPLFNSLRVSLTTTVVCILLGVLSAYAFARLKFKGSNALFVLLIFTEMLPPISFLIPFYIIFQRLVLLNKWYGLVIGYTAWLLPITTWILYSYFQSIPKDLEEAARIDGASRVGALFKVILPVALPGIVASTVICFMFSIGEFLLAVTIGMADKAQTLTVNLNMFLTRFGIEYGLLTAMSVITMIFPVIIVLSLQRFVVEGLTKGAVKE
jgi:multiple sugar transport system permease protein